MLERCIVEIDTHKLELERQKDSSLVQFSELSNVQVRQVDELVREKETYVAAMASLMEEVGNLHALSS